MSRHSAYIGVILGTFPDDVAVFSAVFVQPRYAKLLNPERLHARMGRPISDSSEPPVEGSLAPSPAIPPPPAKHVA